MRQIRYPLNPFQWPRIVWALILGGAGQFFLAQSEWAWTLGAGLLFFAAALYLLSRTEKKFVPESGKKWSRRWELSLFLTVLLISFLFRIIQIDSIPSGLHVDQGLTGLSALRILHEGWRPFFEVFNYQVPEVVLFYQLAAWFGLVGSSLFTFHLFFIFLSLAAFPLIYWTFRQWAGPKTAWLAVFLLAVMRWNVIETRNGYPSGQLPFYTFGTLAFLTYGLQSGKRWAVGVAALFCGIGLYTYQAFKIFPFLLLVYVFWEWRSRRIKLKQPRKVLLLAALGVVVLASPLFTYFLLNGTVGNRERDQFIGTQVLQQKSLAPVVENWVGTALMFNRTGDRNPRHNLPGYRMLDDISGIFFIFGIFYGFRHWKERTYGFALLGLFAFSLPCLLSVDVAHSNRMLGVTPFLCLLTALAMRKIGFQMESILPKKAPRWFFPALAALVLAVISFQNAYVYFIGQAGNLDCWNAFNPEVTSIGQTIAEVNQDFKGRFNFYLTPVYAGNNTVNFLAYSAQENIIPFSPQSFMKPVPPLMWQNSVFILDEGKSGTFDFLKTLFPGGVEDQMKDPQGRTVVYFYSPFLKQLEESKGWAQGLRGTYISSSRWTDPPAATRIDPVLNFTDKKDFPFTQYPPFRMRWTGRLIVPQTGLYEFHLLTTDQAQLKLDGKEVNPDNLQLFVKGLHPIEVLAEKDSGDSMALHLLWKPPGATDWSVVPATAFGKIK